MYPSPPRVPSKVLLIDDSIVDLRLLMEMMYSRQMRVSVALDGYDGISRAEILQPDLILLDIGMPGLNGFGACRLLKANDKTREIPIIFLSAATDVEQRIEGLTLGAVDYINKPFDEREVITRTRIHLEIARKLKDPLSSVGELPGDQSIAVVGNKRDLTLVKAAVIHLRQTIADPPSPEALAHLLGTNEKRLTRAFQEQFGLAVAAWMREERFSQARALLLSTETSISVISDCLGYSTPGNFSMAFKQRFGYSPRTLRK